MKINLELNLVNDKIYLNFWDNINGNDVVAEVKDSTLYITTEWDENDEPLLLKRISLSKYIELVEQSISKRDEK